MKIFLSYASEDRTLADQIQLALTGERHEVFFDRASLPAGEDFHARMRAAVEACDKFIFLIAPDSLAPGSYCLTELMYARTRWRNPSKRVLPVLVRSVAWDKIPVYLTQVGVLEPAGNVPAEVAHAVAAAPPRPAVWIWVGASLATALAAGVLLELRRPDTPAPSEPTKPSAQEAPASLPPAPTLRPASTPGPATSPATAQASAPNPPKSIKPVRPPMPPVQPPPTTTSVPTPLPDCTITTNLIAELLESADIFGPRLALLHGSKTLVVLSQKSYQHGPLATIPMYEVEFDGHRGWISNDSIVKVSPTCRTGGTGKTKTAD